MGELVATAKGGRKGFDGSTAAFDKEILGRGLNEAQRRYIDSLPRIESKDSRQLEGLAELFECNETKAKVNKLPDQELMIRYAAQRRGKRMSHIDFLKKLRSAGVQCWLNEQPVKGLIGLRAIRPGFEQLGVQYICPLNYGMTNEYDELHLDRYGVALNRKYYGWRTALIQLIAKGIISEEKAHKVFGKPQLCEASSLYRRALHQIRTNRGQITA